MGRFSFIETAPVPERALLLGIDRTSSPWPVDRSLDELERLAHTAGAEVVARLTQRLDRPVPRTFIGSGKVEELVGMVRRLSIDVVIFDDELTPSQQSNLEHAVGEPVKIIDRTALILDIFGRHAKTREGRLQVQLAQLQYLLPRLRGMWTHLAKEQTRGGIGSRFGQGESQLEVDRRMVRNRIAALRRQLETLERRREVQSRARLESPAFRIALAGYTNAGKSSLLNRLTGSSVLAQDKLFATLDPTTRSLALPGGRVVTVTDTVGFIQKLPTSLVESFKSTLSEVLTADLICKVVDVSDDDWKRHLAAVESVLADIGADERRALTVFNKVDLLEPSERMGLARSHPDAVVVSASSGFGIDELMERLSREASSADRLLTAVIPYREGSLLQTLHEQALVLNEEYLPEGTRLVVKAAPRLAAELERYRVL